MKERANPVGRVAEPGGVEIERIKTDGRVGITIVAKERLITIRRVGNAGGVRIECLRTTGRVLTRGGVAIQRLKTDGRINAARCIAPKRFFAGARVVVATGVAKE